MNSDAEVGRDAIQSSYQNHVEMESGAFKQNDDGELKLPSCYAAEGSIDAWRHRRMYEFVLPLILDDPSATWMTVGDGRFGSDAYMLSELGCDVTATSLTDESLIIARERGIIEKFKTINAEQIDLEDNAFDYVFCKESYHHFPRPPVAFYEMLRVARRGVILIEPQRARERPLDKLKRLVKRVVRQDGIDLFEPIGNYIFRVDVAQIRDMMLSLHMTTLSHQYFNDFWNPRWSAAKAGSGGRLPWFLTRAGVAVQDILGRLRLMDYGLAVVVVFKGIPSAELVQEMDQGGFTTESLPRNPFVEAD